MTRRNDEEWREQCAVVEVLEMHGIMYGASMNAARRNVFEQIYAKKSGIKRGDPDLFIYDPPQRQPDCHSMAIEMKVCGLKPKTSRAGKWSGAKPHQKKRLAMLEARGWHCVVAYGADDALAKMRAAGYVV